MIKGKILKAEIVKVFGDIKAYWFNYIFGNLNVFFLFFGLFYAFSISEQSDASTLTFLFGLMFWYFGVHAIDLISIIVEEEREMGTLEQLFMTRISFQSILLHRILAQILFDAFKGCFVFALCVALFGIPISSILTVNFLLSVVVFLVALIGLYGIGYIVAGLSLIYRHASSFASISSNVILFFTGTVISIEALPVFLQYAAKVFPLYWSIEIIRELSGSMVSFSHEFALYLLLLFTTVVIWNVVGFLSLNICVKKIFANGSIQHY